MPKRGAASQNQILSASLNIYVLEIIQHRVYRRTLVTLRGQCRFALRLLDILTTDSGKLFLTYQFLQLGNGAQFLRLVYLDSLVTGFVECHGRRVLVYYFPYAAALYDFPAR